MAFPADHRVKNQKNWKERFSPGQRPKKAVKHEADCDTNGRLERSPNDWEGHRKS